MALNDAEAIDLTNCVNCQLGFDVRASLVGFDLGYTALTALC